MPLHVTSELKRADVFLAANKFEDDGPRHWRERFGGPFTFTDAPTKLRV